MEQLPPSLAVTCPAHRGRDRVRRVSVVHAEAAPTALSPVPVLKSADRLAWAGTICGITGAVLVWVRAAVGGAVSGPALIAAVVCFAYAVACYGWAAARRLSIHRVEHGMPKALAVWRAGWYCERCGGVFFAPGEAPAGAIVGQLMSPGQFRELVWAAGGYLARAS